MVKDQKQARYKKIMTSLSVSNFPNSVLYSYEVTITPKNKEKKKYSKPLFELKHCTKEEEKWIEMSELFCLEELLHWISTGLVLWEKISKAFYIGPVTDA